MKFSINGLLISLIIIVPMLTDIFFSKNFSKNIILTNSKHKILSLIEKIILLGLITCLSFSDLYFLTHEIDVFFYLSCAVIAIIYIIYIVYLFKGRIVDFLYICLKVPFLYFILYPISFFLFSIYLRQPVLLILSLVYLVMVIVNKSVTYKKIK